MPSMDFARTGSLLGATLTMGLAAGTFVLYAHTVMPGLKTTDDRTFVAAFQAMDRAIINPWFMLTGFLGALVFTLAAAITQLGRDPFPWVAAALVLYLIAFIVTLAINVPLNDAIKASGVRADLHEARWAAFNLVRTLPSAGAFVCLAWSLVIYGRTTQSLLT
jgi:uncharacterized membrane protein